MTLHLEELNDYALAIVNRKLALHNVTRTRLNRQLAQWPNYHQFHH